MDESLGWEEKGTIQNIALNCMLCEDGVSLVMSKVVILKTSKESEATVFFILHMTLTKRLSICFVSLFQGEEGPCWQKAQWTMQREDC